MRYLKFLNLIPLIMFFIVDKVIAEVIETYRKNRRKA